MLLTNQLLLLVDQCFPLSLQLVQTIIKGLPAGFLEQLLWLLRSHCFESDIVLVPVEGRARIAGRILFAWPSWWLFLILLRTFLLQLGQVLRLLSKWLSWVNQTLLNILLWHVLRHYIYYIDVAQSIGRRNSH